MIVVQYSIGLSVYLTSRLVISTWFKAKILYILYLGPSQSIAVNLKTRDTATEWSPTTGQPSKPKRFLCSKPDPAELLKSNGSRVPPNSSHSRSLVIGDG